MFSRFKRDSIQQIQAKIEKKKKEITHMEETIKELAKYAEVVMNEVK